MGVELWKNFVIKKLEKKNVSYALHQGFYYGKDLNLRLFCRKFMKVNSYFWFYIFKS